MTFFRRPRQWYANLGRKKCGRGPEYADALLPVRHNVALACREDMDRKKVAKRNLAQGQGLPERLWAHDLIVFAGIHDQRAIGVLIEPLSQQRLSQAREVCRIAVGRGDGLVTIGD